MKTNTSASGKKFLYIVVTILLPVLMALVAHEVYVRLAEEPIDLNELTGRNPGEITVSSMKEWALIDAFCAFRCIPGNFSRGKNVNSFGFISTPEITMEKPENTLRIVFLGGSSTAGTGRILKNKETWPWQTVERIREKTQRPVDFINGAAGGYTSLESYGLLWSRIRHFSPDIVVLYHGWNEMYYFEKADNILSWRTRPDGSWSFVATHKSVAVYPPHWIDPLIQWSQSLSRIRLSVSGPPQGEVGPAPEGPLRTDFNHKGLPIWRTNLKLFRETCSILGAKLFVAKQATLIVSGLAPEDREKCCYYLHGFDHDAHVRAFSEIYTVIEEEIPKDSIIDVTPLSGGSDLFHDQVHPTPDGAREIASIVSESLVAYINRLESGKQAPLPPSSN